MKHVLVLTTLMVAGCSPMPVPPAPVCPTPPSKLCALGTTLANWDRGWLARHLLSAKEQQTLLDLNKVIADQCVSLYYLR